MKTILIAAVLGCSVAGLQGGDALMDSINADVAARQAAAAARAAAPTVVVVDQTEQLKLLEEQNRILRQMQINQQLQQTNVIYVPVR